MRERLRQIFLDTLQDLDLPAHLQARMWAKGTVLEVAGDLYALDQYQSIRVLAVGKAAAQMAETADEILGAGRARGLVVTAAEPGHRRGNYRCVIGGHPYPNGNSLLAANAALELLASCDEHTLVLFLISGGGSALFEKPLFDISLDDLKEFNRVLVTCGANIWEMNVLRKHFSAIKGGRLALAAWPARQVTLYVSDVPADKPSTVASGPTMPDESTVADCLSIADRYKLMQHLPAAYSRRLEYGDIPETPKPSQPQFQHSRYCAVLSNEDGLAAMEKQAAQQGWQTCIDMRPDDWPLETAADYLLAKLRETQRASAKPVCLLTGGELSSPVAGAGIGGRNQAFVLACARRIAGERIAVLSAGTDGKDGNSPAAGAVADGDTLRRARALGLDSDASFQNSDSYTFFAALGDEIVTGPTGNNVRDLRILVAW